MDEHNFGNAPRMCARRKCSNTAEPISGLCAEHEKLQCEATVTHRSAGAPTTQCHNQRMPDSQYCRLHDARTVDAAMLKQRKRESAKHALRCARRTVRVLGERQARWHAAVPATTFVTDFEWENAGSDLLKLLTEPGLIPRSRHACSA